MIRFAHNIKYLRNKKYISQQGLANEFGLTRGQLASYEDNRAEPSQDTLIKYSQFFNLPIDVLLKHDLTRSKDGTFLDIGNHRILFPVIVNEANEDVIEVVPMKASAGYLEGLSDPDYISQLPQMKLPFVPTGKHRAFPIKGDSMEPWVREGAFVVGKYMEDMNHIKNGQTYIIVTRDQGLLYKRIYTEKLKKEGKLTLKSDNPAYPPYDIHLSELMELWEYTCKIDIQDYDNDELNPQSIMQMMRSFQVELEEIKRKVN